MQTKAEISEPRRQGKELFRSLCHSNPGLFVRSAGCRRALRALSQFRPIPQMASHPFAQFELFEETDDNMQLRCVADESSVDYLLGFLEALVDFYGEEAVILVQTLRHELRFTVTFENLDSKPLRPFPPLPAA